MCHVWEGGGSWIGRRMCVPFADDGDGVQGIIVLLEEVGQDCLRGQDRSPLSCITGDQLSAVAIEEHGKGLFLPSVGMLTAGSRCIRFSEDTEK